VGYLIEELHTSGRWPLLVYNVSYRINGNIYTEIHQDGSYIILISGPCKELEGHISLFLQQLRELSVGNNTRSSWNPRAKFVVSIMSNCTHIENTNFSRTILNYLWLNEVMNATVLFLKSNKNEGTNLQQNTIDPAQSTYLELYTWYPYENSQRCNPAEGSVPVNVFTVRNLSDIRRVEIFRRYFGKNVHGCPNKLYVRIYPPLMSPPKRIRYNESYYQNV
jgi:hypothetical protein